MFDHMKRAIAELEAANAALEPEVLDASGARELLTSYARARRLVDFGIAALTRKVPDPGEIARVTGTSVGKARETVATGKALGESDVLKDALRGGAVSLEQAAEIAKAEESAPGVAEELVAVAQEASFHVLKDKARQKKLEAEQHKDLFSRQRAARGARSYRDELGMVHMHSVWEPQVGAPLMARAEAEAQRLAREAKKSGEVEPFERYLADAVARLLQGQGKGRARRPELVVLVSHEVAQRGWTEVREGEICKIPGVGPVSPEVARDIAGDAFISGVVCDGTDLSLMKRWGRHIPVEVLLALELGKPPDFNGVRCVDCGNWFRPQFDHITPKGADGPTAYWNFNPLCNPCHVAKTRRDMEAMRKQRATGAERARATEATRPRRPAKGASASVARGPGRDQVTVRLPGRVTSVGCGRAGPLYERC